MNAPNRLFDQVFTVQALPWQKTLESLRMINGIFSKIQLIILDGLTKEMCIASYLVSKQIIALGRKSGWLFVSLYLKQCATTLQSYRGSSAPVSRDLSVPVRLTGSGIPCLIPAFHRREIKKCSAKGDLLIKFYLSVFSLNRIIPLSKKVSRETFSSMISVLTPEVEGTVREVVSDYKMKITSLLHRYVPWIQTIPLEQGILFEPTWKALPTWNLTVEVLKQRLKIERDKAQKVKSCFVSFTFELAAWRDLVVFVHKEGQQWSQGCLWAPRTRYALDNNNKLFTGWDLDGFERRIGPRLPGSSDLGVPMISGRLACSFPGAVKRRIFAIGNYINQRLLRPVHDWFMTVLRRGLLPPVKASAPY